MPIFTKNPIFSLRKTPVITKQNNCRKYKGFLPNITPSINSLSNTISAQAEYNLVYISGENFTPYTTTVNFGYIKNIPIVFYNSSYISFIVPLNLSEGVYSIQVVVNNSNNYNPSSVLYSNTLDYTIQNYTITGDYLLTDSNSYQNVYNTVITFTSNGTILFYTSYNIIWNITGDASVLVNGILVNNGSQKSFKNAFYYITLRSGTVSLKFNV